MKKIKKEKILRELKKNKKEWGDKVAPHIDHIIKNFDSAIKYKDTRNNIEAVSGIKVNIEDNSEGQYKKYWIRIDKKFLKKLEKESKLWPSKSVKERLIVAREFIDY